MDVFFFLSCCQQNTEQLFVGAVFTRKVTGSNPGNIELPDFYPSTPLSKCRDSHVKSTTNASSETFSNYQWQSAHFFWRCMIYILTQHR